MRKLTNQSQVFAPFRAVGFVSNHVPLVLDIKGSDHFVTTVVGKSYHIYNCSKLKLLFVGEASDNDITTITVAGNNKTVVAAGNDVLIYQRGKIINTYHGHECQVHIMQTLGEYIISIDEGNHIHVWSHQTRETYLSFSLDKNVFHITACVHPATYLNKILLGSKQGKLQLWNIRTNMLIHEIPGWNEEVLVLEQAPAVDVIAIGLQNGRIVLHNIKYAKTLMSFYQEFGLVTSITFRTDGTPIMASGSATGHISLWDLEKKECSQTLHDAHSGMVSGMKFFQKQPLLISSSPDNSLKIWIFDNPDGTGRLLKSRCGHSGPPARSIFYGSYGNVILTTGTDCSLRYTSIMRGEQCHEFSQGSLIKESKKTGILVEDLRLPRVTCIAANTTREDDWDNVVTCHLGMAQAITWSSAKRAIGKHKLKKEESNLSSAATALDISSCGNFVIVGYQSGILNKFNLQSGLDRGCYGGKGGHKRCIRGVSINNANLLMVSTSADKSIKFWDFKTQALIDTVACHCPIAMSKLHRESSLLAVAFDDFTINVYDIDTRSMVRQLVTHANIITDLSWSSDARWIISASMDGTIKTSDVPSSRLIDCFLINSPAISCAFSPSGEFLVTTHQDNVGIYLWSNKVTYSGVYPSPLPNDYQPTALQLPTTQIEVEEAMEEELGEEEMDGTNGYKSPEQLGSFLITLSTLPESRWRSLMDLEHIKERNKPKQPPKKPKAAPFFIPTISGLETKFDTSKTTEVEETDNSRFLSLRKFGMDSVLNKLLKENHPNLATMVLDTLKKMSPSETDVEFRLLGPDGGGSQEVLSTFVKVLIELTRHGMDYELIQSYISLFLKLHGEVIITNDKLKESCQKLLQALKESCFQCQDLLNQSICLVNYFKSATV